MNNSINNDESINETIRLSRQFLYQGHYAKSLELLQKMNATPFNQQKPQSNAEIELQRELALIKSKLGPLADAKSIIESLVNLDEKNFSNLRIQALIAFELGEFDKSEEIVSNCEKIYNQNNEQHQDIFEFACLLQLKGKILSRQNKFKDSIETLFIANSIFESSEIGKQMIDYFLTFRTLSLAHSALEQVNKAFDFINTSISHIQK